MVIMTYLKYLISKHDFVQVWKIPIEINPIGITSPNEVVSSTLNSLKFIKIMKLNGQLMDYHFYLFRG